MDTTDTAIASNIECGSSLNWTPADFGCSEFGPELVESIKEFQASFPDLIADGICDAVTWLRLQLDRDIDLTPPPPAAVSDRVLVGGELLPIAWDRVVTTGEEGALVLPSDCYRRRSKPREVNKVVTHWDVTTHAHKTFRVLAAKGISTHFVIDWDGTIYQLVDMAHEAWHAGIGWINRSSVGIDFNTPVYPKYNDRLVKRGQPERPRLDNWRINGWAPKGGFLGPHQVQLDAYAALLAACHEHMGVPLDAPARQSVDERLKWQKKSAIKPGVYHHAEVDYPRKRRSGKVKRSGKWDTAGVVIAQSCAAARALL